MPDLLATAAPIVRCKCCGGNAPLFHVLDFHQNVHPFKLPISGIPIYYYRCKTCGFLFTTAFDQFTHEDFAKFIYNADYEMIDTAYHAERAKYFRQFVLMNFAGAKGLRLLDYGGGNGKLAQLLRSFGYLSVDTYDPFVHQHAARPTAKYDLVLCFEVVEHSTKPAEIFADIASFLGTEAMAVVSTQMQPADIVAQGTHWQYINPRAGHASIYSPGAFRSLLNPMGLTYASGTDSLHAIWRNRLPLFAQHLAVR
jgi:2-polyprenyl-6-hydroxyphenyl methylase/3-demethylubiquinone-9 3-methyltransferase